MSKQLAIVHTSTIPQDEEPPSVPMLMRSSEPMGWDGLVVREYNEPHAIESWLEAVVPDAVLVLVTQGSMQLESQRPNGTWSAMPFRQGDLSLRPGGSMMAAVRWSSDCSGTLQTLHLHVNQQLICRIAEESGSHASSQPALSRRMGFQDPLLSQIGFALRRELVQQGAGGGKLYAETAAQMLAVHLLRHYPSTPVTIPEPTQGLTRRQLERVLEFLLAHLSEDLSLESLAQQSGFSAYY